MTLRLIVLFGLTLSLFSCATTGTGTKSAAPGSPTAEATLLPGENPAPDFTLIDAEGRNVSLTDYRGKIVWLSFWATWCQACKQEMTAVGQLKTTLAEPAVAVLAVNTDGPDRASESRSDARALRLDYPILFDPDGRILAQYKPNGDLPFAVLILGAAGIFVALRRRSARAGGVDAPLTAEEKARLEEILTREG